MTTQGTEVTSSITTTELENKAAELQNKTTDLQNVIDSFIKEKCGTLKLLREKQTQEFIKSCFDGRPEKLSDCKKNLCDEIENEKQECLRHLETLQGNLGDLVNMDPSNEVYASQLTRIRAEIKEYGKEALKLTTNKKRKESLKKDKLYRAEVGGLVWNLLQHLC